MKRIMLNNDCDNCELCQKDPKLGTKTECIFDWPRNKCKAVEVVLIEEHDTTGINGKMLVIDPKGV